MSKTVLITGANRGIGLEFVHQYATDGWQVLAGARNPDNAEALRDLASQHSNITVIELDITSESDIAALIQHLDGKAVDCLINNAGLFGAPGRFDPSAQGLQAISREDMLSIFNTNTVSTLFLCRSLLHNIAKSQDKIIAVISSQMGSISNNDMGSGYAYRASKAALNAVMKSFAIDVAEQEINILMLHPGWVQTDMGGANALLTPSESVSGMRTLIHSENQWQSGEFFDYAGNALPF